MNSVKSYCTHAFKLICALLLCIPAIARDAENERVVVRFSAPVESILEEFLRPEYDVAFYKPGVRLDIVMTATEYDELVARGYDAFVVRTEEQARKNLERREKTALPGYRSYAQVVSELRQIQTMYPGICKLYDIGDTLGTYYSDSGISWYHDYRHEVWALKVSDNAETREDEPAVFYAGEHHAREPISVEVTMAVLYHILQGYGGDPEITGYVDNTEIWFVPIVNPNGHRIVTEQIDVWWRKNLRDNDGSGSFNANDGVDPNRNYGFTWGGAGASTVWTGQTYRGLRAWSEPEIEAMENLMHLGRFVTGITYHSYGEVILFPYCFDRGATAPDHDALQALAAEMALSTPAISGGTYDSFPGWQLYPCSGTNNDYAYGVHGVFAYTVELAPVFIPPANQIEPICDANIEAAMILLDRVNHAILAGHVTDSVTGEPVKASVFIEGIDNAGEFRQPCKSGDIYGRYHRPLLPGYHTVTFTSYGYEPARFENVQIRDDSQTVLDVALIRANATSQCQSAPLLISHDPDVSPGLSPTLRWNNVSGATDYMIQIFTETPFTTPVMESHTGGATFFTPHCDLPEGDIFWRVSSDLDYSCFSPMQYFAFSHSLDQIIAALQITAGLFPSELAVDLNDIDNDGKKGIEEAVYIMQKLAGLR